MFEHFARRLQRDIKTMVDVRIGESEARSGTQTRVSSPSLLLCAFGIEIDFMGPWQQSTGVDVRVITHKRQRFAVWYGGSFLANLVSAPRQLCI